MAQAVIKDTRLRLSFETGMNEKGEPIYKAKTYSNIKKDAAPDELSRASQALGGLCEHPLTGVEKLDNYEIVN